MTTKEQQQLPQITNSYYSKDFEEVNEELRRHFQLANREIDNVKDRVNVLVSIVHNDNKDWSVKKICEYISGKNDDLNEFGFSTKTIYNYLNEENRQLIDARKHKRQKGDSTPSLKESQSLKDFREQKGTVDFSCKPLHETVPEQSSITKDELENVLYPEEEAEDQKVIYDSKFVDNLIKENEELKEENRQLHIENAKLYKELEKWKKQKA